MKYLLPQHYVGFRNDDHFVCNDDFLYTKPKKTARTLHGPFLLSPKNYKCLLFHKLNQFAFATDLDAKQVHAAGQVGYVEGFSGIVSIYQNRANTAAKGVPNFDGNGSWCGIPAYL